MSGENDSSALPISWDEAREVVIVILLGATALLLASPIIGWFDPRLSGNFDGDLAIITRGVGPTTGLMLLASGVLVATTPRADMVPMLRQAVVVLASIVVVMGLLAIVNQMLRPTGTGFAGQVMVIFGRSGPGTLLAGTARWLAMNVVPFDD